MVRGFGAFVLAALAVTAQTMVILRLLPGDASSSSWALALGWQLAAALSAGGFFVQVSGMPASQRPLLFLHAFFVCLVLPVGGQLIFLVMWLAPLLLPCSVRHVETEVIQPPKFHPDFVTPGHAEAVVARLRRKLELRVGEDDARLRAMIAMRSLPQYYTGDLLSSLLSDPLEEIRLLAYGISTAAETAIVKKIVAATEMLETMRDEESQARLSSELAELHWELIYQKLVQGELWRHTLDRVEGYARVALSLDESNAAMWCLLGRCALLRQEPLQAEFFLLHAKKRGFPEPRILPWIAEAAFLKREFSGIGPLLSRLRGQPLPPNLQSTVNYWTT